MRYDVAISGAGPDASAAIITGRAKMSSLVIDADDDGMTSMAHVHHQLGLLEISSSDLVERGQEQLPLAGAHVEKAQRTMPSRSRVERCGS